MDNCFCLFPGMFNLVSWSPSDVSISNAATHVASTLEPAESLWLHATVAPGHTITHPFCASTCTSCTCTGAIHNNTCPSDTGTCRTYICTTDICTCARSACHCFSYTYSTFSCSTFKQPSWFSGYNCTWSVSCGPRTP